MVDLTAVREAAGSVEDPEIRRPLGEMDLLDEVAVDGDGHVTVHYHLTSPLCPSPFAIQIGRDVRRRVEEVPGVSRCTVAIQDHYIADEISRLVNDGDLAAPPGEPGHALAGRREAALLDLPSVARCADLLARRTRLDAVVRAAVSTLDRFRASVAPELETLLDEAREDVGVAEDALARLASALRWYTDTQVATLAFGPKVWFRANGVPVAWRPLPSSRMAATRDALRGTRADRTADDPAVRTLVLSMVGSGLGADELVALRVGDVGSMDSDGRVEPDLRSEPLAVQRVPSDGEGSGPTLAFLGFEARDALLSSLVSRQLRGESLDDGSPLFVERDGTPAGADLVRRARRRHLALIGVNNKVNVSLCRATGDFFREWGMPGSHWQPTDATQPSEPPPTDAYPTRGGSA